MIAITGAQLEQLDEPWLVQWTDATERKQAEVYQGQRARQFLAGRALSRWLAVTTFAQAKDAVLITRRSSGAPELTCAGKVWSLSISHCAGYICVALTQQGALGLDVEAVTRKIPQSVVEKFQQGFFAGAAATDLLARWLLAEAVTKAHEGKLLTTLRESASAYSAVASYFQRGGFMICCYATNDRNSPIWIDFQQ